MLRAAGGPPPTPLEPPRNSDPRSSTTPPSSAPPWSPPRPADRRHDPPVGQRGWALSPWSLPRRTPTRSDVARRLATEARPPPTCPAANLPPTSDATPRIRPQGSAALAMTISPAGGAACPVRACWQDDGATTSLVGSEPTWLPPSAMAGPARHRPPAATREARTATCRRAAVEGRHCLPR